ncbi:spore coat protein [Virgibacillus doumboii]|uniref:spore coat protein n=1 Tax=Virgibacillus doumboii TaxID=2697503 RepID=UPI00196820D7|nr:spore coat protein [Virgibacillus doumboii]
MSQTKWRALDQCDDNTTDENNAVIAQDADQSVSNQQVSDEWIIIKDSEDINVTTTDRQVAFSLQLGIQAAIGAVINITVGENQSNGILQDLKQVIRTRQGNHQKTIVEQSREIQITTRDTDIAVNIQLLFQILATIVATLDI